MRRSRQLLQPDVVHLQGGVENDVRILWLVGVRPRGYAYTVHDPVTHPGDRAAPRLRAPMTRRLLAGAGLVFVHAEALRDELLALGTVSAPVEVVPHGIDTPVVMPLPSRPSILFFGRISTYKGLPVLFDAMPSVWAELPETRLVVAGEGTVGDHPVAADQRVVMRLGHVPEDEVPELFGAASLVVLPYVQASQSGVGSLAKRHGRPVVATCLGGLPELVADGSGVTVPAKDRAGLAQAMLWILRDRVRAEAMGRAGAASAAGSASWRAVGERTLAAYERHGLLPAGAAADTLGGVR